MSNSLYTEAIAEAKQLREAAEANAKKAIIEAMTPQIKRLVEKELLDEAQSTSDLESDDFMAEIFGLDESEDIFFEVDENVLASITEDDNDKELTRESKVALKSLIESFRDAAVLYNTIEEKDDAVYEKFELIASNIISEAKTLRDQLIRIVEGDGSSDADTALSLTLDTIIKETIKMSKRSEDEVLYELDLSELNLFEEDEDEADADEDLDLDLDAPDEGGEEDEAEDLDEPGDEAVEDEGEAVDLELDPDAAEELLAALKDALGEEAGEEDVEGDDEGGEEEVEEAMYAGEEMHHEGDMQEADTDDDEWIEIDEGMLRREIAAMRALSEAPDLLKVKGIAKDMADQFGGKGSGKSGDDFGGGKRGKDPLAMSDKDLNVHAENKKLRAAVVNESRKNRDLQGQLSEAVDAVNELQTQLKEMNLFNAKLLYANKLLQNKNISTRQMRSIVESLDNARSLREVKLLYKTMTESISSKKKSGSINESTVRKAVGSSRPTRSATSTASDTEVDRWATLAGLK